MIKARIEVLGQPTGRQMVRLSFDSSSGAFVVILTADEARALSDSIGDALITGETAQVVIS